MKNIRSNFIFNFLLVLILPLLVGSHIIGKALVEQMVGEANVKNQLIAETLGKGIDSFANEPYNILINTAYSLNYGGSEIAGKMNNYLGDIIKNYKYFESIIVLDKNGRVFSIAPYKEAYIGIDYSGQEYFKACKNSNSPHWSDIFISLQTGNPTLSITVPIRNGYIVGFINLEKIQDIVKDINLPNGSFAEVIDEDYSYIAHTNFNNVIQRERERILKNYITEKNIPLVVDYNGEKMVTSIYNIQSTGWRVIVCQKERDILLSLKKIEYIYFVSLSIIILMMVIYLTLCVRTIVNPLNSLLEKIKEMASNNYNYPLQFDSYNEFNDIAKNFNIMAANIISREHELKSSRAKLKSRAEFEGILSKLSTEYINGYTNDVDSIFINTMKMVGEFINADRAYAFRLTSNETIELNVQWKKTGAEKIKYISEKMKFYNNQWFVSEIQKRGFIFINSSKDLPDEAVKLKELITINKMNKIIVIPMISDKKNIGYISFDSKEFRNDIEEYVENLRIVGEIAANVITRMNTESELKCAKEIAEKSNKAKSMFLANMSHEIRTPMNGIIGTTELLNMTETTKDQKDYIEMIEMSARSLLTIINDILDISRIESGRIQIEDENINITELIENTVRLFGGQANKKGLNLVNKCSGKSFPLVKGDIVRIRQIIINLLGNAIKFTDNGYVKIDVSAQNISENVIEICILVSDSGIGIPEEKLECIFEPFTQADSTTTKKYGGTGLGLAIVQMLTNKMHGRIEVNSRENMGSTFAVFLPLRISKKQGNAVFNTSECDLSVLYVGDSAVEFKIMNLMFQRLNWIVSMTSPIEAYDYVLENNINLILVDGGMYTMNFISFVKELLEKINCGGIKIQVAVINDNLSEDEAYELSGVDYDYYIQKPINIKTLEKLAFDIKHR